MTPAPARMMMAALASTYPAAGVMATSPAPAPAAAPITLGRCWCIQLAVTQVRAAIAAAVLVTTKALTASPPDERALPALKPNQPNHSNDAPRMVMVASCGSVELWP